MLILLLMPSAFAPHVPTFGRPWVAEAAALSGPGVTLEEPASAPFSARSEFRLAGSSEHPELMLMLRAGGRESRRRIPVVDGRFDTWVWLPWGAGVYEASLWRWDAQRQSYLGLLAFRVTNVEEAPTQPLKAGPLLQHTFDPEQEQLLQPASVLQYVNGRVPIDARTVHPNLMVTIDKDGDVRQYVLPAWDGRVKTALWLSRGPGRYAIGLWAPVGDGRYLPWADFVVENQDARLYPGIEEAPLWFENGEQVVHLEGLEAMVGDRDGRLLLRGVSRHPYLRVSVEQGGERADYRIPVAPGGRFEGEAWLRFGDGTYVVTLWGYRPESRQNWGLVRFAAQAEGVADVRFRAPSVGVESDHPAIVALARQLAPQGAADPMAAARAVHAWVTRNIAYDVDKFLREAYGPDDGAVRTLELRSGVCQDYTYLTVALLRAAGLEARIAVGRARGYDFGGKGSWGPHAWTEVRVGDRWLTMDTTWDAGYVTAAGEFIQAPSARYFDPDPAAFAEDHLLEGYQY